MIKKGLLILIMLLFVPVIMAADDSEWRSWQRDSSLNHVNGSHIANNEYAQNYWDDIAAATSVTFSAGASSSQVLTADVTGDDVSDMMLFTNNYLELLGFTAGGEAYEIAGYNMMSPLQAHPAIYEYADGRIAYVAIVNNTFKSVYYDSTFHLTYPADYLRACTVWEGLRCNDNYCYALCENLSLGNMGVFKFDMTTNTTTVSNITNISLRNPPAGEINPPFAMTDLENDGDDDIVFACDANNNGLWGVCVIDTASLTLNSYFSSDGIVDDWTNNFGSPTDQMKISSPLVYNLDRIGDKEIIVSTLMQGTHVSGACTLGSSNDVRIQAFRATGASYWLSSFRNVLRGFLGCVQTTSGDQHGKTPFIAHYDGDDYICLVQGHDADGYRSEGCINPTTGAYVTSYDTLVGLPNTYSQAGFAFLKNGSYTDDYVFMTKTLYYFNASTKLQKIDDAPNFNHVTLVSADDVTGDNNIDLIATKSTETVIDTIYLSSFGNEMPELNDSLQYGGYTGWYNGAVCKGTTITFRARECPYDLTGCNYNNDNDPDLEVLYTDCGTSTATTGSSSLNNPTVSCTYNNTGTYTVYVSIYDLANSGNLSEYNTNGITVNVIDGIPGTTCNIASTYVSTPGSLPALPSAAQTTIDSDIDNTLGLLFGTSTKLKLLCAIGIIIAIMISVASYIKNAVVIAISGILTMIGLTFLGLIPLYIMILFLVGTLLIMVMAKFIVSDTPTGD